MARLNTIAIGPGRGSAGDATYRKSRGRTIMSARIKENPSKTALQEYQRYLFGGFSTAVANQPWFVANFSKSKYGSEVNHLQHLNRAFWQSTTFGDMLDDPEFDEFFLEQMCTRTWEAGYGMYFAHGAAPYYGTTQRLHAGLNLWLQDIIVSAADALRTSAVLSIHGKVHSYPLGEKSVNATFRLTRVDANVWSYTQAQMAAIFAEDKLPFYIDGAGLAHILMPWKGWKTTSFEGWSSQWKSLGSAGVSSMVDEGIIPEAFHRSYGTAGDFHEDFGIVMLHINGEPVTYYQPGEVINSAAEQPAVEAVAPKKATKKSKDAPSEVPEE